MPRFGPLDLPGQLLKRVVGGPCLRPGAQPRGVCGSAVVTVDLRRDHDGAKIEVIVQRSRYTDEQHRLRPELSDSALGYHRYRRVTRPDLR